MITLISAFDLYLCMFTVVNIVSISMPFSFVSAPLELQLCPEVQEITLLVCEDNGGIKAPDYLTNTLRILQVLVDLCIVSELKQRTQQHAISCDQCRTGQSRSLFSNALSADFDK